MSIDMRALAEYGGRLETLRAALPEIVEELVVGEGVYAVK